MSAAMPEQGNRREVLRRRLAENGWRQMSLPPGFGHRQGELWERPWQRLYIDDWGCFLYQRIPGGWRRTHGADWDKVRWGRILFPGNEEFAGMEIEL